MQATISLGRIFGIEIGLHYSFLIIAFLIFLSVSGHFAVTYPQWSHLVIATLASVTALLFFVSIVIHELSHAVVARANKLPVMSITLFALGGVANIQKDADKPAAEFWMAIVGPITSVVIGAVCLLAAWGLGWAPPAEPVSPLLAGLVWLGYINIVLAGFNMIPGFPLDGGRVLRAAVWLITDNSDRATRIAARVGQVVALAFMFVGLLQFFGGSDFGGLWLAVIGWFLSEAAQATYSQVELTSRLKGVRVRDVMSLDTPVIDSTTNLQKFIDELLLKTWRRCFLVVDSDKHEHVIGLITPQAIKHVPKDSWTTMTVGQAMLPLAKLKTVAADMPVVEALQIMGQDDLNQVPVISGDKVVGVLTRGNVLQLFENRSELTSSPA